MRKEWRHEVTSGLIENGGGIGEDHDLTLWRCVGAGSDDLTPRRATEPVAVAEDMVRVRGTGAVAVELGCVALRR